jgi:hypothetical protein
VAVFAHIVVVLVVGSMLSFRLKAEATDQQAGAPEAPGVLAAAREALGGEKRLSAVRTFIITGRTRQVRGDNLVPIEFEIACELPDKFVRKDEIPAQESEPTTVGFNKDALIQFPPLPPMAGRGRAGGEGRAAAATGEARRVAGREGAAAPGPEGRAGGPPRDPRASRVTTVKQDFARLTLGMFAASFDAYPLAFTYAGAAEAPQGKADVLNVKGPGTFALRLFVSRETHLPIMVSWPVPATTVVLRLPGQTPANVPPGAVVVDAPPLPPPDASQEEKEKYTKDVAEIRKKALATAKPVEHRVYYADYREVDGLQFPFRIRRAIGGETIEETTIDRFRINAKIDPRKFEVQQ